MKIVFLPSAASGLAWFRRYYTTAFPEGARNASLQFEAVKRVLESNPQAGRAVEGRETRIYIVPRTPFAIIYRLRDGRIEIMAVHDQRSYPSRTS